MDRNSAEYNDVRHLFNTAFSENTSFNNKSISDIAVIYPPTIDWDWMKQRPQQLMEALSLKGIDVYYCNKAQLASEAYTKINSHLTIVHNNIQFINNRIPELKKQGKKIVIWVSWSKLQIFLDDYHPDFTIYDYLDDFDAWKPYLKPMVEKADIIVTTSDLLKTQIKNQFPNKTSYFIPNGCDLSHFRPNTNLVTPSELINHKGPVITYSGAWAKWVDHELVYKIAHTFKEALVIIIGPEFGATVNKNIANLKYLGYKSYNELPAYLQLSTVCIIPFLLQDVTLATNPIKMYEYLASGTPVVATDIPEVRNVPSVFIGINHDLFIEKIKFIIDKRLTFNSSEVYEWLESHSWEGRCNDIISIFNKHIR